MFSVILIFEYKQLLRKINKTYEFTIVLIAII